MALITLDQALAHLRLKSLDDDQRLLDVRLKMAQAEAIVLDLCNTTAHWRAVTPTWTDETNVPSAVQAAMLIQLESLYLGSDLSATVNALITRHSDPVVA